MIRRLRSSTAGKNAVERGQLGTISLSEIGCIAANASRNSHLGECPICLPNPSVQGMKERIACAFRQGVHFHGTSGKHSLGNGLTGLTGALVGVGEDGDVRSVCAARGRQQALGGEFCTVIGAEEGHQLVTVRGEVARGDVPLRPGCGRIATVLGRLAGG